LIEIIYCINCKKTRDEGYEEGYEGLNEGGISSNITMATAVITITATTTVIVTKTITAIATRAITVTTRLDAECVSSGCYITENVTTVYFMNF